MPVIVKTWPPSIYFGADACARAVAQSNAAMERATRVLNKLRLELQLLDAKIAIYEAQFGPLPLPVSQDLPR